MTVPGSGAASLRADALRLLDGWAAPSAEQERLRAAYLDHVREHPDAAERGCFPRHLTAGAVVLSADRRRVLLNLHRKARRWFAFGGHVEPGDTTLAATAAREAAEESGLPGLALDPDPVHLSCHRVDFCDPRGPVEHLDVRYLALAPDDAVPRASQESLDVRWWPVDALPTDEPDMVELVRLSAGAVSQFMDTNRH